MKALFISLALLIVFPVSVMIADGVTTANAAESRVDKKTREKTVSGVVMAVDPAARAIVIKGKDEYTFTAEKELLIGIKVKDTVIVKYKEAGGKKYAQSIRTDLKKKGKGR